MKMNVKEVIPGGINTPFRFVYARDFDIPIGYDSFGFIDSICRDVSFCYTRTLEGINYAFVVRKPDEKFVKSDARFYVTARYEAGNTLFIDWATSMALLGLDKLITDDSQNKINILDLKHSAISHLIIEHYTACNRLAVGVSLRND